jgi:tetratricopeptide (TPR) repeat protein
LVESISKPLAQVYDDTSWFVRATELRVLRIRSPVILRDAVEHVVLGQLYHADNHSLIFRFEDPVGGDASVWDARAQRFITAWDQQREQLAEAEVVALGSLTDPAPQRRGPERFTALLAAACQELAPPLAGLLVVLVPARVDEPIAHLEVLRRLIAAPELTRVRWICIDLDHDESLPLTDELGPERSLSCVAKLDEDAQQRDLRALIDGLRRGVKPSVALGSAAAVVVLASLTRSNARGPGAGPKVTPPPRVGAPPPPSDELLREVGIEPSYFFGGAALLQVAVLEAALAYREGRREDATARQHEAVELCAAMNLPLEQVINTLVLGGYALAAGQLDQAQSHYEQAVELATGNQLALQHVQGLLALGMLHALAGRPAPALECYREAGELAERSEQPVMAIEAWRMAGQLALDHQAEDEAILAWGRGLEIAQREPAIAPATSAGELALRLAASYRARGFETQALALEDTAHRLQHGHGPEVVVERDEPRS